jgi:hypothetical protein
MPTLSELIDRAQSEGRTEFLNKLRAAVSQQKASRALSDEEDLARRFQLERMRELSQDQIRMMLAERGVLPSSLQRVSPAAIIAAAALNRG